jgi:hypothetical protein
MRKSGFGRLEEDFVPKDCVPWSRSPSSLAAAHSDRLTILSEPRKRGSSTLKTVDEDHSGPQRSDDRVGGSQSGSHVLADSSDTAQRKYPLKVSVHLLE